MRPTSVFRILLLILSCATRILHAQTFQSLGRIDEAALPYSEPNAISADGTTIVGRWLPNQDVTLEWAFLWQPGTRMRRMTFPALSRTNALDVSGDGRTVLIKGNGFFTYVWNQATGTRWIGDLGGGSAGGVAISADGRVVVGRRSFGIRPADQQAFRWTLATGIEGLDFNEAYDVSADGSVIVGRRDVFGTQGVPTSSAPYTWRNGVGSALIQTSSRGVATAVSDDGSTVFGWYSDSAGNYAFRSRGGMQNIDSGAQTFSPLAASADGSTAVGEKIYPALSPRSFQAVVWTETAGLRTVQDILERDLGVDLGGWWLMRATAVSADGRVVTGYGTSPSGYREAWRAELGESRMDVSVTATGSLTEVDWDKGRLFATYTATVRNQGGVDAKNVTLDARIPKTAIIQGISNANCVSPQLRGGTSPPASGLMAFGGSVNCAWNTLAGRSSVAVEIVARIVNATDLHALQSGVELQNFPGEPEGVKFTARADDDPDASNNEALARIDIPFRDGSYDETRDLMKALDPYFDYTAAKLGQGCNQYKDDIFERLERIRATYPEVFQNLSYGGVTSGDYFVAGIESSITKAGHVGVVVYPKGTNYRDTGIIINGTPTPSPLWLSSEVGGDGFSGTGLFFTAADGRYLRTPADKFPGLPQHEGSGLEGQYAHNSAEFTWEGAPAPREPSRSLSCPFAPDAVALITESPVEVLVTNPRGRRVETRDGRIVAQELDGGIHSMAFPHEDGTYGWTLALPVDDYDVQLRGTREGAYTLTLMRFAADGMPIPRVTTGVTTPGKVDRYVLDGVSTGPAIRINAPASWTVKRKQMVKWTTQEVAPRMAVKVEFTTGDTGTPRRVGKAANRKQAVGWKPRSSDVTERGLLRVCVKPSRKAKRPVCDEMTVGVMP